MIEEEQYQKFLETITQANVKELHLYGERVAEVVNKHYENTGLPVRARVICNLRQRALTRLSWPGCLGWLERNGYGHALKASTNVQDTKFVEIVMPHYLRGDESLSMKCVLAWENNFLRDRNFDMREKPEIKRTRRTSDEVLIERQARLAAGPKKMGRPLGSRNKKTSLKWILQGLAPELFEVAMWASRDVANQMPEEIKLKCKHVLAEVEKARA